MASFPLPALKTSYMKTTKASWLQAVCQSHAAQVYGRDRWLRTASRSCQRTGGSGFLERCDELGEGAVVNPRRRDGETDREMGLSTPGGPNKMTFSLRSTKPSSWRFSICSRLMEGWNEKSADDFRRKSISAVARRVASHPPSLSGASFI